MRDLLESLDRILEAPRGEKGAGPANPVAASKPEDPRTVTNKKFGSISDFIKALKTPGQQGGSTAAQTKANLAKATAPVKSTDNEFDKKSPAAIKKTNAASKPAAISPDQASALGTQAIAKAPVGAPRPFANVRRTQTVVPGTTVAKRAKVKATAANTKDFDKTMALQKKLISMGADIKADGLMGPNTRAAMAKFMPAPSTTPKSNPIRTGANKTPGPDPMGLANPSPEVRAQGKQNAADRRAATQKKSREFWRNLGNTLFPKANF